MHIKAEKAHAAARVGDQDLALPTDGDRSIETYYELLRSGRPLSEVLRQAIGNSDHGQTTQSDVAVRSDFEDQEANTRHELPGHIQVPVQGVAGRPEPPSAAHARSETLSSTGAVERPPPSAFGQVKRWAAVNRRSFGGLIIATVGTIGIFLYPPLTETLTSHQGTPFRNTREQQSNRPREEPFGNAIDRLANGPAKAISNIELTQPSTAEPTFGNATGGSTALATGAESRALPTPPASNVDVVSPGIPPASAAAVEITLRPEPSSTPAMEAKIDHAQAAIASAAADLPVIANRADAAEIAGLLSHGDAFMEREDVASARLYYQRAADVGDAHAALRLGETYDPLFLALARLNGVRGDAVLAAHWYRRARDLGSPEAETLLNSGHTN